MLPLLCFAQRRPQNINQELDKVGTARQKADWLIELAFEQLDTDAEEALNTARLALEESRKARYQEGEGMAMIVHGMYYAISGKPGVANGFYWAAHKIGAEIKDSNLVARALLHLGRICRDIGKVDSAMWFYKRAMKANSTLQNQPATFRIFSSISHLYPMLNKPDSGLLYARKSYAIALQTRDSITIAYGLINLGDGFLHNYQFDSSRYYFDLALSWSKSPTVITDYNEGMGLWYFAKGNLEDAFNHFYNVLQSKEVQASAHNLSFILMKLSEVLEQKGLLDISSEYLYKSIQIARASGYMHLLGEAEYQLAWVNIRTKQYKLATDAITRAEVHFGTLGDELMLGGCYNVRGLIQMHLKNFDSSKYYHYKGLEIRKRLGGNVEISSSLFNLGDLHLNFEDYNYALKYFDESYALDQEMGDQYGIALNQHRIGKAYSFQGKGLKAEEFLENAIRNAKKTSSLDLLSTCYLDLAIHYERGGNIRRALDYRKEFEALNDSLFSRGTTQTLASYQTLYDVERKKQEIEILNKDKQLQTDKLRQRSLVVYWVISIAIVLALLAYALFNSSFRLKKMNVQLSERSEEIQAQSEELLESNTSLQRLNEEIENQREEIQKQAEMLMEANLAISQTNQGLENMVLSRTKDLRAAYRELDTFFYRSSHDLRRPITTIMGLAEVAKLTVRDNAAIELFDKVNETAVNLDKMLVKFQAISDVGSHELVFKEVFMEALVDQVLSSWETEITYKHIAVSNAISLATPFISYPILVKIVLENLVENALDFSDPTGPHLIIRGYSSGNYVVIEVEDNGEGIKQELKPRIFEMFFRGSERSKGNGLGLYIAKKAVEKMKGEISYATPNTGKGTIFKVVLPNGLG